MWQWFFRQIFLKFFWKISAKKSMSKIFFPNNWWKKFLLDYLHKGMYCTWATQVARTIWSDYGCSSVQKKWIFSGTLKLKNYAFLRNFREWNVWRSWSKDNLIEKELSETKAKKLFSDRIWNVLRSQTGKSKYTGSAETAPGPWSSSLNGSSSICVRRVRSGARKRLPCGKRATRPVECHRSRASFRRRFFAIFWLFFIGLSGYPRGRTLT